MILLAAWMQLLGCYALYTTSQRAVLPADKLSAWLRHHRPAARWVGMVLCLLAFGLFVDGLGWGAGILTGCIAWMTAISLVVILFPLFVKPKHAGKS
ncbi:MAG TPA: hypothetical protein VIU12_22260 [Chryseolinea sp.]